MEKLYKKIGWKNRPNASTPLGATNLKKIDEAIDGLDNRTIELDNKDAEQGRHIEGLYAETRKNAQAIEEGFDALKIVPTASGTTAYMDDASNMRLEGIDFYGESKQMQTTGKNLYAEYRAGTSNAINMNHLGVVGQLEPDTVYYIAFKGTVGNKYVPPATTFKGTIEYPLNTITVQEGVNVVVAKTGSEVPTASSVSILKNAAYNSDPNFSDVMVMKVNEPEPYEPYTGRKASPNPDYPQPIESKIVEKVIVSGKNFFGFGESAIDKTTELRPLVAQRLIFTKIDDNTIKCNYNGGNYGTGFVEISGIDGTKDYAISFVNKENSLGYTPRIEKYASQCTESKLVLSIYSGSGNNEISSDNYFILSNIQVELGTTVTPFEQFKGIQTVNLSAPIELNGIGDVRDTDKVKKFGVVVFDGSENWVGSSYLAGRYGREIKAKETGICMCSMATNKLTDEVNCCHINQHGSFYINTSFATLDEWKAHLQANPMTVVYELAEPIETELPQADIDAIKNLHTYKPNTVVMNDADAEMDVQYVADAKTYIDKKFEALASAIEK